MATTSKNGDFFQSTSDLQDSGPLRESILLCGRYGSGKTCAMISMAYFIGLTNPDATFYVIDIEQKFRSALDSFGVDAPQNLKYRSVIDMNEAGEAMNTLLARAVPGDWVGIETLPRLWQGSQDLAYQAIAGVTKVEFLDRKRKDKSIKSPIPEPADFWPIANGSQYGDFLDLLAQRKDLNIIASTTVKFAKNQADEDRSKIKTSAERKALRMELGVNFDIEGAPRAPSYIETICHLSISGRSGHCRVLRDNLWRGEELPEFPVADRKGWGTRFQYECRGSEEARAFLIGAGVLEEA